ncbi:hypothetical protein NKJ06_27075 [Mesorhizobium sp. M0293]|uniref:hypothetical protein n=1 Tax=unclassified Mesorhizobium TaxID=325217 RepID=UPI00333DB873
MMQDPANQLSLGLPVERVAPALGAPPGQELESGKFGSPQSSSALDVNGFGSFLDNLGALPPVAACSWREWPAPFPQDQTRHAKRVIARFHP